MKYQTSFRLADGLWLFAEKASVEERRRLVLRTLAEAIGCMEGELVIVRTADGKPMLKGPTDRLFFNTAHREGFVLMGLAWNVSVGVDLEVLPCLGEIEVAGTFFSTGEQRWLSSLESDDGDAFAHLWTAKEATLKAIGTGITHGMVEPDLAPLLNSGRPLGDSETHVRASGRDFAIQWFPAGSPGSRLIAARALEIPSAHSSPS